MRLLHDIPRLLRTALAILWTIVLTILLLQPTTQPIIPTGIQGAPPSLERELLFSTGHILTFAFTVLVWSWALHIRRGWHLVLLCGLLLAYGVLAEYAQSTVPGRAAQWWDMLANGIGVVLGIVIVHRWS